LWGKTIVLGHKVRLRVKQIIRLGVRIRNNTKLGKLPY